MITITLLHIKGGRDRERLQQNFSLFNIFTGFFQIPSFSTPHFLYGTGLTHYAILCFVDEQDVPAMKPMTVS